MCFGGGDKPKPPSIDQAQYIKVNPNFPSEPAPWNTPAKVTPALDTFQAAAAKTTPYTQGLQKGQITQGLDYLSGMGDTFSQNAQNAANPNYNPAIPAFWNATQQNMMNTAGALASQRGTSGNPMLMARNIGTTGALTQQMAVNQMGSLVNEYKMQQEQQALQAYNAYAQAGLQNQAQILGAIAAENAAKVAMQSNVNTTNQAAIAANNAAKTSMYNAGLAYDANIFATKTSAATAKYGMGLDYNKDIYAIQSGQYNAAADRSSSFWGNLIGSASMIPFMLNKGGEVPEPSKPVKMATGGPAPMTISPDFNAQMAQSGGASQVYGSSRPSSYVAQFLQDVKRRESSQSPLMSGVNSLLQNAMQPKQDKAFVESMNQQTSGAMESFQMPEFGKFAQGGMAQRQARPGQVQPRPPGQPPGRPPASPYPPLRPDHPSHPPYSTPGFRPSPPIGIEPRSRMGMSPGGIPPRTPGLMGMGPMVRGNPSVLAQPPILRQGPGIPNLNLVGSPNPAIAAPPTGLPMGNSQTRGGGSLPGFGQSGGPVNMNCGGKVPEHPKGKR